MLYPTQDEANTRIYKTFTELGIEIPYAKQDVYLYPMKGFPKTVSSESPQNVLDETQNSFSEYQTNKETQNIQSEIDK